MSGSRPTNAVRIGTRGSTLALVQAELVCAALAATGTASTIVVIETAGDRRAPDSAWGEGAFVAAIERALLDDRVDVAVHSAKDVPTDEDPHLRIAAYLSRADARDALVLPAGSAVRTVAALPAGARVGTDSPRRTHFLRARRPDLQVHPLHGNVDTRLRRLDAGETDALILACAGLDRLGRSDRIAERLDPEVIPPAPGQGAIAIQARAADADVLAACAAIDDRATRLAVEAERAFLRAAGGGCRAPFGALATVEATKIRLFGAHAPDRGAPVSGRRAGPAAEPAALGRLLAADLGLTGDRAGGAAAPAPRPRVVVTRAVSQAGALMRELRTAGLDPIGVPAIRIDLASFRAAADRAAGLLTAEQWVVVTSPNGARALLEAAERVLADLGTPAWAAVGAATRTALERAGIEVAFVPTQPNAEALAVELPIAPGARVLVLRGDLADGTLAATLRTRGADVDDLVGYRTIESPPESADLLRDAVDEGPIAAMVFTSGSTVSGLMRLARVTGIDLAAVPAVCIGEPTAAAARAAGLQVRAVAGTAEAAALAAAVATAIAEPDPAPTRHLQEIR